MKTFIYRFCLLIIPLSFLSSATGDDRELFRDYSYDQAGPWTDLAPKTPEAIEGLLQILQKSSIGQQLITKASAKALDFEKELKDLIEAGPESITDTTFIRRTIYDGGEFQTVYNEVSHIILNKQLTVEDAVINLAHELTHFVFRKKNNPYQDISLDEFIKNTVEGKGGEVDATLIECRVMRQIYPKRFAEDQNCQQFLVVKNEESSSDELTFSREEGIKLFYRLGSYWSQFEQTIKEYGISPDTFPSISRDQPLFFSAIYGVPYPLAAVDEYKKIVKKICRNEQERINKIKEQSGWDSQNEKYQQLQQQYLRKCSSF